MTLAARRLLAAMSLVLVVLLTLGPSSVPDFPKPFDSLPHFIAYAVATAAVIAGVGHGRSLGDRRWWAYAAVIAIAMTGLGVLLELGQRLVDRDVEVEDAAANALGVATAIAAMWVVRRARRDPEAG